MTAPRSRSERRTAAHLLLSAVLVSACSESPQPAAHPAGPATAESPLDSAVLIVVDTLRADRLGSYGYERRTTPELNRWAQGAAVFDQALAPSPWTLPSMGSLYTGRLPLHHGAGRVVRKGQTTFRRVDEALPQLAIDPIVEVLRPRLGCDRGAPSLDIDVVAAIALVYESKQRVPVVWVNDLGAVGN